MDYSWFVGFAPADDPKIAVAAVVVNGLKWRIHAPYVAREAFRAYLVGGSLGQPPVARVHRRHRRHRQQCARSSSTPGPAAASATTRRKRCEGRAHRWTSRSAKWTSNRTVSCTWSTGTTSLSSSST